MGRHVLHIATANAVAVLCMSKLPLGRQPSNKPASCCKSSIGSSSMPQRAMKPIKVTNGYSCDSVPKKRNRPIQLRDWLFRLYFVSPAGLVDEDSSVSVLCKCFTIQPMMGKVEFAWMTVKPHTMVAAAATPVLMLRGCSCDDFYSWT